MTTSVRQQVSQCLKWSKKEAGSLPQSEIECPSPEFFYIYIWSENGEFWCILRGLLCDLELQDNKQETRYKPGKSNGSGSPTLATRPHFKPWGYLPNTVYLKKIIYPKSVFWRYLIHFAPIWKIIIALKSTTDKMMKYISGIFSWFMFSGRDSWYLVGRDLQKTDIWSYGLYYTLSIGLQ